MSGAARSPLLFRRWTFKGARPFHGGGTTNAATGERYDKPEGYGVGLVDGTAALSRPGTHGRRVAHEKAAQQRLARRHPETGYVGSWRNGTKVHYDPAAVVNDLDEAIRIGKANNQKAVWDFKNQREIAIE